MYFKGAFRDWSAWQGLRASEKCSTQPVLLSVLTYFYIAITNHDGVTSEFVALNTLLYFQPSCACVIVYKTRPGWPSGSSIPSHFSQLTSPQPDPTPTWTISPSLGHIRSGLSIWGTFIRIVLPHATSLLLTYLGHTLPRRFNQGPSPLCQTILGTFAHLWSK